MLNGRMSQGWRMPRMPWRKQSFCQSDSKKYSLVVASPGREFFCMVLLAQGKHTWLKLAPLKQRELSFLFLLQIWWVSMWERVKNLLSLSLTWLGRNSLLSFSLMRSTLCAGTDPMVRMRLHGEWRLSFWCRCRESVTMTRECWSWVPLTCHGLSILLFDVVSKGESTFLCLSLRLGMSEVR